MVDKAVRPHPPGNSSCALLMQRHGQTVAPSLILQGGLWGLRTGRRHRTIRCMCATCAPSWSLDARKTPLHSEAVYGAGYCLELRSPGLALLRHDLQQGNLPGQARAETKTPELTRRRSMRLLIRGPGLRHAWQRLPLPQFSKPELLGRGPGLAEARARAGPRSRAGDPPSKPIGQPSAGLPPLLAMGAAGPRERAGGQISSAGGSGSGCVAPEPGQADQQPGPSPWASSRAKGICCSGSGWLARQALRRRASRIKQPPSPGSSTGLEAGRWPAPSHSASNRFDHQPDKPVDFQRRRERKSGDSRTCQSRSWAAGPALERPCFSRPGRPAPAGPCAGYVRLQPEQVGGGFPSRSRRRRPDRTVRPASSALKKRGRRAAAPTPFGGLQTR